jgi:hypothetical protein
VGGNQRGLPTRRQAPLREPSQGTDLANEVFKLGTFQVPRHHLALDEWAKCGGVPDLAAEFHAGYRGLQIVWVRQIIRLNLYRVERIGPRQTEMASAFAFCKLCRDGG